MTAKFSTVDSYHRQLLKDLFAPGDVSDNDALLLMAILHTCEIELTGPVLKRSNVTRFAALTQRDAADAVAYIWSGTNDPRRKYTHWYFRWNGDWNGYRHLEELSPEERSRLLELKAKLESHPTVKEVVPEAPAMFAPSESSPQS